MEKEEGEKKRKENIKSNCRIIINLVLTFLVVFIGATIALKLLCKFWGVLC